jgi:hypothetical protein
MAEFLRHASRHVHATIAKHVKAGLTELNWTDPALTPLGASAVRFQTTSALQGGRPGAGVSPGLVSITLGNEAPPSEEEMGGPLHLQEYPIFIDVFMETEGECTALACDVRDILLGRFEFAGRVLPVVDQVTSTDVPGWILELDDVERMSPEHTFSIQWQVVKVTASAYYNEVVY